MIMKITGHKTERNFFRYVRLEKEVNANLMRKFMSLFIYCKFSLIVDIVLWV